MCICVVNVFVVMTPKLHYIPAKPNANAEQWNILGWDCEHNVMSNGNQPSLHDKTSHTKTYNNTHICSQNWTNVMCLKTSLFVCVQNIHCNKTEYTYIYIYTWKKQVCEKQMHRKHMVQYFVMLSTWKYNIQTNTCNNKTKMFMQTNFVVCLWCVGGMHVWF